MNTRLEEIDCPDFKPQVVRQRRWPWSTGGPGNLAMLSERWSDSWGHVRSVSRRLQAARMHCLRVSAANVLVPAFAYFLLYGVISAPLLWNRSAGSTFIYFSLVLAVTLALLSAVDLYAYRLPDALTVPLAALGLLASFTLGQITVLWSAASAAIGFILLAGVASAYRCIRGRDGLGLGDAKLLAASGAWLSAEALPTVLLWATGTALAFVLIAYRRDASLSGATRLPFGPFLSLGTWLVWLYGPF